VANPDRLCLEDAPGHARLAAILADLDIESIPLLPDFRRAEREGGQDLYRLSDGMHWNEAGHALAAERVVAALVRRGLLPDSASLVTPPRQIAACSSCFDERQPS
jgi:hypothetical protein